MNRSRLFVASCCALVATAMAFAIRADIMDPGALPKTFGLTNLRLGWIAGAAFWGFAASIFIGSPLCDALGMGRLMGLAFLCHCVGVVLTIFAPHDQFWILWSATLILGLGNGLVEAVINPLIATIYADDKTHKLNVLHAWWPGGQILAGLAAFGLTWLLTQKSFGLTPQSPLLWQIKMALILIPTVIYGILLLGQRFPATERVASGVSTGAMFKEALRPMFLLWFACMWLTAATELAPMQWLPNVLTRTAAVAGIVVLVYINVLMFCGRNVAGPLAHRLSPVGLLWFSAILSAAGLFWLSYATNAVTAFAAAAIYAAGICYFWPTMLGVTSERFPRGGALLLGVMGAAGNLSIACVLPLMGGIYDHYTLERLQETNPSIAARVTTGENRLNQDVVNTLTAETATDQESKTAVSGALAHGAAMTFRWMAIVPLVLIVIFGAVWLSDQARGGYKAVRLHAGEERDVVPEAADAGIPGPYAR